MPMMNSSVKTPTTPQQSQTTTKKFIGTGGFFNFIHRSNSNQNKSSSSSPADDSKQLKRTTSTQRRPKQYISNENKRLSADIEPLHTSSASLSNAWKEHTDKVQINAQKERPLTKYSTKINRNSSSNVDSSIPLHSTAQTNRSSISLLTKPANTIMKSNEGDSLNNGLLFQPNEIGKRDSFLLSPSSSFSHANDSSSSSGVSSSIGKMMQTSTLVISTPPQYHYYLYPPAPTKKPATNNRTVSNVSMNSISTNSSSSSSSYDSQIHDLDDDTSSCSAYQNKIYQSASYSSAKPVTLSDSVQAFWPPQASFLSPTSLERNQHSNLIKNKQSEVKTTQKNIRSPTRSNDSSSITTGNQTDVLSPPTSLISNKKEEARSYTEQTSFHSPSLRPTSDTSFEDTPASYSELLRAKSRSITNNRTLTMNVNTSSLSRSRSKDTLNNQNEECNSLNRNVLRPKSAGQTHIQALLSPVTYEISNDFQSKRQFFENRIYSDNAPISACPKVLTLPPTSTPPRHVIK
ncbi:unnamed protein product [Adineta ricciae]|nr:unnamed protein product [Adineta ricciae]